MNPKLAFLVSMLSLAILAGCAGKGGPSATITSGLETASGDSLAVRSAREYFSAIIRGDTQGAKELVVPGARCTPADLWTKVDSQLALLGSAEVKDIVVSEKDISQIVEIYAPDAQAACVTFEYRNDGSPAWRPASICVVVETGICDTWLTEK